MEFKDKTIVCKDCGKEFVFEAGQQEHFHSLGFTNEPVRCKECRDKRKNSQPRNNNFGGRNNRYDDNRRAA